MSYQSFSRDSTIRRLKSDTVAICLPHGRKVGAPGHDEAKAFLVHRLEEIGCVPYTGGSFELPYHRKRTDFCNIIGVVPGRDRALAPILVGAHYDSVINAPCADDNAAAVAIALSTAEMMIARGGLQRDLIIAIFDAEEPPYFQTESMGSRRFWQDQRGDREIHAAVIMDLVGHDISIHSSQLDHIRPLGLLGMLPTLADRDIPVPLLHSLLFMTGGESHPELPGAIESAGKAEGLKLVPTLNRYIGDMSDHGIFRENGVPYLFLSCGQWAHYHQPTDTPDRLNYRKMERITRQVFDLLVELSGRELRRTNQREVTSDTLGFETGYIRRAFGPLWSPLLKKSGLAGINHRADMDKLVRTIMYLGLAG